MLENLIDEIHKKGFRIHNLFELTNSTTGKWQANLNRGEEVWEFGHGDTPGEALKAALARAESSKGNTLSVRGKSLPEQPVKKQFSLGIIVKANAKEIEF